MELIQSNYWKNNFEKNEPLFIGLNGFAGAGKDSVAKMLKVILNYHDKLNKEDCYNLFINKYPNIQSPSTENGNIFESVFTIAFADQLKKLCSDIFGVPEERFYYNKSNAWVCVNHGFKYTEVIDKIQPENIISAQDFYERHEEFINSNKDFYMSLREILVYVGKYLVQGSIHKDAFINIVNNKIYNYMASDTKFIIITDVRFVQELSYIRSNNGIMINIVRPGLEQLNNIAEHELDEEDDYDFTIINDSTYQELFNKVYDLIEENKIFNNNIFKLQTRDGECNNFLRENNEGFELCTQLPISSLNREEGRIISIEPVGGPIINIGDQIIKEDIEFTINNISLNQKTMKFNLK